MFSYKPQKHCTVHKTRSPQLSHPFLSWKRERKSNKRHIMGVPFPWRKVHKIPTYGKQNEQLYQQLRLI